MKKGKVYKVKWRDAFSRNGWHIDESRDDKDDIVITVGSFLRDNKYYWFMYQSISQFGTVAEVVAIPKKSVISKELLK